MTYLYESHLYQLWLAFVYYYEASALRRLLDRISLWCSRQIQDSVILKPLCREGAVAMAWRTSLVCGILTFLINLPGLLLRKLYETFAPVFDGSIFAQLAFMAGRETAAAQSWLIMAMWVIPFDYWDNAYSLMSFTLLLLLFYMGAMGKKTCRLDLRAIGFYPVLFFVAVMLSVAFSYAPPLSQRFFVYHLSAALCVLVTVSAVRNAGDLKRLAAGGAFCVLVSSIYGIVQRIQGVPVNPSYVDVVVNAGMPGRVQSFFDNPNTFSEVLLLLLPLTLALVICSERLWTKALSCLIFAAGVVNLGMTYSRASWVGFACALAVMVFLWKPNLLPAFFVLFFLAIPLLPSTIWNRILTITNTNDTSTSSRFPLYQAALQLLRQRPVSGAGLGTAAAQAYIKKFNLYHARAPYVHAHNFYLEVWIETGLLGLAGFVGGMLWNIKRAARTVQHCPDSAARTITCAAAAAMCGTMVCGIADYLWHYPRVMCIFWFVFAMALAGIKICRKEGLRRSRE